MFRGAAWLFAGVALTAGCAHSDGNSDGAPEGRGARLAAVRAVLEAQVAAWNRHDLDAFMAGYWESDALVFATTAGVTQGHAATLARYKKSYDRPERFGRLEFAGLVFEEIDSETELVRGSWRLHEAPGAPHGRFVLIVRRFDFGWRVVSDYTTSAPP